MVLGPAEGIDYQDCIIDVETAMANDCEIDDNRIRKGTKRQVISKLACCKGSF